MSLALDHDAFPADFDSIALERGCERMGEIVPSMEAVRLIVTPDFEAAVRERLPEDAGQLEYAQDRGALGTAMARVMPGEGESIDVIIDSRVLSAGQEEGVPDKTFEHEAYHVAIRQRGECLDFAERKDWKGGVEDGFLHAAEIACEEFRVELPICRTTASSHYVEFPAFLIALDDEIRSLSRTYQETAEDPDAVTIISRAIGERFGLLVTTCGYVAASMEGRDLPLPEVAERVGRRILGTVGPSVIERLRGLPGADVEADPGDLEASARTIAIELGAWIEEIGFGWREVGEALRFDVLNPRRWLLEPR